LQTKRYLFLAELLTINYIDLKSMEQRLKGKHIAMVAVVLVVVCGLSYWFYARVSCAKNARVGGTVESQVYRQAVGMSNFSEEKYRGCMRSFGF